MEREIKFRGFSEQYKIWVYGLLDREMSLPSTRYYIIQNSDWDLNSRFEVDSKSVGQSTGCADKNSREIFEGDLLECNGGDYSMPELGIVKWEKKRAGFVVNVGRTTVQGFKSLKMAGATNKKIVGNVYTTPMGDN